MPGLIEQGMTPQGAAPTPPPQGAPPTPPAAPKGAGTEASGVDKKNFDIFVANGMKLIHNPKVSDRIIAMVVDEKGNKAKVLATATLNIVSRLEESAAEAGKKLSPAILAYGANVLMGEIITSAEAAGMEKLDDKTKYQALSLAVGKYLDDAIKTGKMTKEELIKLGEEAGATPMGQKINQLVAKQGAKPGAEPPTGAPPTAPPSQGEAPVPGAPPPGAGRI